MYEKAGTPSVSGANLEQANSKNVQCSNISASFEPG